MKHILMLIIIDGVNVGLMTSTYIHLVPTHHLPAELAFGYCLISMGAGTMIGGYFGGKLCDVIRVQRVASLCVIAYVLSCMMAILVTEV